MTYKVGRSARIGFVILVGTALIAGISGDAVAMAYKGRLYARSFTPESPVQFVSQEPVWLEPMRYYGGPKSPMWREVR
jgi:hypothetical protein